MRELIYAVEGKAANLIKTFALDEPGHGGACHKYAVLRVGNYVFKDTEDLYKSVMAVVYEEHDLVTVEFQNGPINSDGNGVNGVQIEDLTAINIDRLEGFQSGPYACQDNAEALEHFRKALECLQRRTKARIARGVEGTHTVCPQP